MKEGIEQGLTSGFFQSKTIKPLIKQYEQQILNAEINPYEAAQLLLSKYFEEIKKTTHHLMICSDSITFLQKVSTIPGVFIIPGDSLHYCSENR